MVKQCKLSSINERTLGLDNIEYQMRIKNLRKLMIRKEVSNTKQQNTM